MGANRFMSPVQTQYQQTYIDQHVPLPFEILQKAADNRQKVYDTNAQQAEIAKSWLDVKHREYDKVGYDRIKQSYEGQIADAVEGAGGDYSVIGPKIRAIAATIKSDMNDGELSVIASNYNGYQADLKHKQELEDKGDLSGLNAMNMMAVSDAAHRNSVDPKTGIGRYSAYHHALDVDPNKELAGQLAHMKASSYEKLGGILEPMKAGETTLYAKTKEGRKAITSDQIESVVNPYLNSNPKVKAYLERNVRALYGEEAYKKALADILTTATGTFKYEENTIDQTLHGDEVGNHRAKKEIDTPPVIGAATETGGNPWGIFKQEGVEGKRATNDDIDIAYAGHTLLDKNLSGMLAELNPGKPYNKKATDSFLLGAMVRHGIIKQGTKLSDVSPASYNLLMDKIADGKVNMTGLVGTVNGAKAKAIQEMARAESNRVQELKDKREEAVDYLKEHGMLSTGDVKIVEDFGKRTEDLRSAIDALPKFTEDQKREIFSMVVNGDNLSEHEANNRYNGVQAGVGYSKLASLPAVKSFMAHKKVYENTLKRTDVRDKLEDVYDARAAYTPTTSVATTGNFTLDDGTKLGIRDGAGAVKAALAKQAQDLYTNKIVVDKSGVEIPLKTVVDGWIRSQRKTADVDEPITEAEIKAGINALNGSGDLTTLKSKDGKNLWKMTGNGQDYYLKLDFGPNAKKDTRTYAFNSVDLHPELKNRINIATAVHKGSVNNVERSYIGDHKYGVAVHNRKPETSDEADHFVSAGEDGSNFNISIDPRLYGIQNKGKMVMIPQGQADQFQQDYHYAIEHGTDAEIKAFVKDFITKNIQ